MAQIWRSTGKGMEAETGMVQEQMRWGVRRDGQRVELELGDRERSG